MVEARIVPKLDHLVQQLSQMIVFSQVPLELDMLENLTAYKQPTVSRIHKEKQMLLFFPKKNATALLKNYGVYCPHILDRPVDASNI